MDIAFEPVVGASPKVLILGSMPGVRSLEDVQYYAHPQNAFWPIIYALLGSNEDLSSFDHTIELYENKLVLLQDQGIALWDVAHACIRPGSLDSDIDHTSVVPNDFESFLGNYPSIKTICFNGRSVESLFKRHVLRKAGLGKDGIQFHTLPSTSPANASITKQEKLKQWQVLLDYLKP